MIGFSPQITAQWSLGRVFRVESRGLGLPKLVLLAHGSNRYLAFSSFVTVISISLFLIIFTFKISALGLAPISCLARWIGCFRTSGWIPVIITLAGLFLGLGNSGEGGIGGPVCLILRFFRETVFQISNSFSESGAGRGTFAIAAGRGWRRMQ